MANVQIKDGAEAEKYLKSTGAGSDGDAYIPQHLETNSADIKTAVELLDNAISGSRMLVTEDNSADIKTAVETVASAVSTQMQVDVVGALPTGSNAIGATKDNGPETAGTFTYTTSADMTSVADVGPAPSGGEKSVLLQAVISTDTAMQFTIQMADSPGNERQSWYLPASGSVIFVPRHPVKVGSADKKWQGIASVAGNVAISTVTTSEA